MQRRDFLATMGLVGARLLTDSSTTYAQTGIVRQFHLKYAPHFGMFKSLAGPDLLDQLRYASEQGFTAWEDNGMPGRPVKLQEQIGQTMADLGMTMGVFVANKVSWGKPDLVSGNQENRERFLSSIRSAIEIAKRVNAKWITVVPGHVDNKLQKDYQTANVIEILREAAAILEPHNLVMVLEPLNWWANHAGQFLVTTPQAYMICKAVNSPSCKILFDIYHQQVSEGNLIPTIDKAWDQIAYFQVGDNPGRKEPGTGEINYRNVFRHIYEKGFKGVVGMEHGNSQNGAAGEQAVIEAYIAADDF